MQNRAGITAQTPSFSQYFSWINNTNEGATATQTAINLSFFSWLRDSYGMQLDIYAFDAGAIDGAGGYGNMDSERFHRQFPQGFAPLSAIARSMDTRLGLWCGPDGFGETDADEQARHELMVSLCRDHQVALFKMDQVCGDLRPKKQQAFVRMMSACREYQPDLILLNHRLDLGPGLAFATTFLWEGWETYIDVHMKATTCVTRSRACVLTRGNVPELQRLTEDHGVCLSSCLDGWEDDLVVQAFGRALILAPQLYGNPWLLRDDEYPRLARIFQLHRRVRQYLVQGITLAEDEFGPHAVSRGNGETRILCLRNPSWESRRVRVPLSTAIGLEGKSHVKVRLLHPRERWLGTFAIGSHVDIQVEPFRACLLLIEAAPSGVSVAGVDAAVVREMPNRPVELQLLGLPGTTHEVRLDLGQETFVKAILDGVDTPMLLTGAPVKVDFPGSAFSAPYHRCLGEMLAAPVPDDQEALYEATAFAADNNALEVRELVRSGPTAIPQVQAARDAFFQQPLFKKRHVWDCQLWDDDQDTGFGVARRWVDPRIRGGSFRLDLGRACTLDTLSLTVPSEYELQPLKSQETVWGAVSVDLRNWVRVAFFAGADLCGKIPADRPWRYVRIDRCPDLIREVHASYQGIPIQRIGWRATNLFASVNSAPATHAWELPFRLTEATPESYLCINIHGQHGRELAWAGLRVGTGTNVTWRGCPRRSPSFPSNTWECPSKPALGDSSWYIPITPDLVGVPCTAVAMLLKGGNPDLRCDLWITAPNPPHRVRRLVLER